MRAGRVPAHPAPTQRNDRPQYAESRHRRGCDARGARSRDAAATALEREVPPSPWGNPRPLRHWGRHEYPQLATRAAAVRARGWRHSRTPPATRARMAMRRTPPLKRSRRAPGMAASATRVGAAAHGGEGTGWGWAPAAAGASTPSARRATSSRQTEDDHPHRGPAPPPHRGRCINPRRTEPCAAGVSPQPPPAVTPRPRRTASCPGRPNHPSRPIRPNRPSRPPPPGGEPAAAPRSA